MRDVLRAPGALSLFAASCVARLPMGALGLLLVLHTQQLTGSYAKGGLASGAYAIALALSNPALARIVDRRGQTLVLRIGAPLAAAAILVLATLPDGAPLGAILAAAAVAGACQPPVGACMRALWPVLLDSPDRRHAAYSMEGALLEIVYICGPRPDRRGHRLLVDDRRAWRPARPSCSSATSPSPRTRSRARGARTRSARATSRARCADPGCACSSPSSCCAGCRSAPSRSSCPPRSTRPATAS